MRRRSARRPGGGRRGSTKRRRPDDPSVSAITPRPTHDPDRRREARATAVATIEPTITPARRPTARSASTCRHSAHSNRNPAISKPFGFTLPARNSVIGVRASSRSGVSRPAGARRADRERGGDERGAQSGGDGAVRALAGVLTREAGTAADEAVPERGVDGGGRLAGTDVAGRRTPRRHLGLEDEAHDARRLTHLGGDVEPSQVRREAALDRLADRLAVGRAVGLVQMGRFVGRTEQGSGDRPGEQHQQRGDEQRCGEPGGTQPGGGTRGGEDIARLTPARRWSGARGGRRWCR